MAELTLGTGEARFADIIWENEPITASQLVKNSENELKWKKTTSYTVLKRLCEKGIFQNVNGVVTSLISKKEFFSLQSEKFVEETFGGSLPAFVAAFTSRKSLSAKEVKELRELIDKYGEE
ncbi:MAG: BlaI/MecI/CopY family transcriptional regulator [Ruminococcaceae bacterium]|nr:BlaI/MecI/CopY family transcriptional regulator [Oscillospiraceae bacterium]